MDLLSQPDVARRTIGDLVSKNYAYASVFRRFDIDFCCGGGRTLAEACAKKEVNVDELVKELSRASGRNDAPPAHACHTYRALFETLADFESDLHRHVHLENNVLYPHVAALERTRPAGHP